MTRNISSRKAINQLGEFGFEQAIDFISEYSPNADLYFKQLDIERFILFNHYNKNKSEELQGFNCWLSTYKSKSYIGKIPAIEIESIKSTFNFEGDWALIAEFL